MQSNSSDRSSAASRRYVWYVIALLTVVNAFNYMDRMALAVLAPSIGKDLHLSDTQLGLLTGFAFAVFYAVCGIPIAQWADRGIRRDVVALALTTWSVMTALSGAAQNFWHLLLARIGVGAGEAGGPAPSGSILCDYVPLVRRPLVFAIHAFGLNVGMLLGMGLAGRLAEAIGWRWTFVVLGIPGFVLAAIVRFTLREPIRGVFDAAKDTGKRFSVRETMRFLVDCRTYRLLVLYLVVLGFVQFGLSQWLPSFYVRVFDLSLSSIGVYLGLALGVGSGIGTLVGGLLASKAAQRNVTLPFTIGMVAIALTIPAALGLIVAPTAWGSVLLVAATFLLSYLPSGAVLANLFSVVRPQMRAMAGAASMFAASLLGFGLGPFCVGLLSDLLAPSFGVQSLRYALLAPICLLPILIVVLRAASRTLQEDLKATSLLGDANANSMRLEPCIPANVMTPGPSA